MEDRFENFTYLVLKTGKIIQRIKNIEMEKYGLKAVHVMCIYHLSKHPVGLTNKEIVSLTFEDKAAISRALTLLMEKNIVTSQDGESRNIFTLTDYGKKIANYIDDRSMAALKKSGLGVTDKERDEFYSTLRKIEKNIENHYQELLKK